MGKAVETVETGVGIVVGMSMKVGTVIAVSKLVGRQRDTIEIAWTDGEAEEMLAIIAAKVVVAGIVLVIAMDIAGTDMTDAVTITAVRILVVGIVRTVVVVIDLIEIGIVHIEVAMMDIDGRDRMGEVTPSDGIRRDGGMITSAGTDMVRETPVDRRAMVAGMVVRVAATIGEAIVGTREIAAGETGVVIEVTDGTAIGKAIGVPGISRSIS